MSRSVLITGGAGGMGLATAGRFTSMADRVMLADIDAARLHAVEGESISTVVTDVSSVADCDHMVAETLARHGGLDILVCAAGLWVEGPTVEMTEDQWDRTIDVNLKGAFFSCVAAIPPLIASQGSIVLISSDYGLVGGPGAAIYCASKFGVNGLMRSLALELAPKGVRVNSVCPADVETPMLEGQAREYGGADTEGYYDSLLATLPQGPERARFIRPDEIAAVVAFLSSPEAEPINGVSMPVEWGVTTGY
jgi:NAD(P)-dependent dehydrogenase (short-subunit alcohol dehydrogenase family)